MTTSTDGAPQRQETTQSASEPSGKPAEASRTPSAEQRANPLEAVADLLRNDAEREDEGEADGPPPDHSLPEGDGDAGEGGEDGPLAAMAKAFAEDPEKAYAFEITTGDGQTVTLGALKDAWQDREAAALETARKDAELSRRESATIAQQSLFADMGDALAKALPPQVQQQYVDHLNRQEQTERRKALEAMPELADPTRYEAFRGEIAAYTAPFGFRPEELVIRDHRMLRVLKDAIQTKRTLEKLMAFKPSEQPPAARRQSARGSGKPDLAKTVERAKSGTEADKLKAVAQLIR